MKFTIFNKLLFLLLILGIIPLAIFGYMAVNDIKNIGDVSSQNIEDVGEISIQDSTTSLNQLGEQTIELVAKDVAKQLEIYIKDHPTMTVADLQNDAYFSTLAVQPVGKTGYTAITDVDSLWCRWHVNPNVANSDLHNLAEKLPGFWSVMERTQGGVVSKGYYDWAEPDGSIKQKYMYIAIVDARTADNVQLSVAATTYIDEFSAPVVQTKEKISNAVTVMLVDTESTIQSARNRMILFVVGMLAIISFAGFAFAKSITSPIKDLKKAADKVTSGDFDFSLPKVRGNDEVAELTGSMEMLITALKHRSENKETKKK